MANISALGSAPMSFVDATGKQYSIPLSFVSYSSANGPPIVSSSWPGWAAMSPSSAAAGQANVNSWLAVLAAQGLVTPAPLPPALPAFTITAVSPGGMGNNITIRFNAQNIDGSLNVTVSTTQNYTGLNFASGAAKSIEQVLGSSATNGTQPALAYVSTAPTVVPTATVGAVNFAIPSAGTDYEFELPGTTGILTASNNPTSADAGLITATIANVSSAAGTFDLTLSWSKTVASVTPATLGASFGYLIAVTPPPGGFGGTPAVPSTVTLVGGANVSTSPAAPASATVISS